MNCCCRCGGGGGGGGGAIFFKHAESSALVSNFTLSSYGKLGGVSYHQTFQVLAGTEPYKAILGSYIQLIYVSTSILGTEHVW